MINFNNLLVIIELLGDVYLTNKINYAPALEPVHKSMGGIASHTYFLSKTISDMSICTFPPQYSHTSIPLTL